ncbi:MAG: recombinase family protein [Candidatus Cryptobacteroides sp.]
MAQKRTRYEVSLYERLSREDGDRLESDSIINQQRMLEDYCGRHPELHVVDHYSDDGFTGTNFDRPAFKRLLEDIETGKVNCVIVKDLSRFGRDYIDMGYYLERYFPAHGVRFIAINDGVDSERGPYDMMLPLKNVFNAQYAKDISEKVRSAFEVKQRRGEFVGAFASYGYLKDPENHNHLVIDPVAGAVVRRIFEMAAAGMGQVRIALTLNEEKVPCPSEYKRLMGEKYTNSKKLDSTRYWTYATVHRMLRNEMYLGNMVQHRSVRPTMHGKAQKADPSEWIVAEGTHDAIVSRELWDTVQAQVAKNSRTPDFEQNVGLFAGFLKCADCGRAMVKTRRGDKLYYSCGSYRRYGATACTCHGICQNDLEKIILKDLNEIIRAVGDLRKIADENREEKSFAKNKESERKRLEAALARVRRLKQGSYEDYQDKLLSREEFLRYKADYDKQEQTLLQQIENMQVEDEEELLEQPWVEALLSRGELTELDRVTLAQTVKEIRIFEGKKIEITYLFSDELRILLEKHEELL